jgi:hypothetical protein
MALYAEQSQSSADPDCTARRQALSTLGVMIFDGDRPTHTFRLLFAYFASSNCFEKISD